MRRRVFIGQAAGACALAGCSSTKAREFPPVSITRAPAYDQRVYSLIRNILSGHNVPVRGKNVVIKPNLVEFDAATTINTHPLVVHATFEAVKALGAASVRIAEGPGHRRITLDLADAAGYFSTIDSFEQAFTDLNLDEVTSVRLSRPNSKLRTLYLPNTVLGCDLLISLPKLKTHHWVGATLSMKNLFGTVPGGVYGWPKNVLHWAGIDECIADLYNIYPKTFAIVDGITGMEGNGPIQGTPKHAGVLVAGQDFAAVDAVCCRIMGIEPSRLTYLRLVGIEGKQRMNVRGEPIESVASRFQLPPGLSGLGA